VLRAPRRIAPRGADCRTANCTVPDLWPSPKDRDQEMSLDRIVLAALLELSSADCCDWDTRIQQILRVDARVLCVERVSYWRMREDPPAIVCEMSYQKTSGAFERGSVLPAADHVAYFEAIHAAPVSVPDAISDPRSSSLREYLQTRHIASLLDFPVWVRGRIEGILCHEHVGAPRRWTTSDEHFAATVAQVVASSLAAHERTQAEGAARRAAFLDKTSRTLGETLDVDEVSRRALALVVPWMGDGSAIVVVEDGGKMRRLGYTFATAEGRALLERVLGDHPPSGSVIVKQDSLLLPIVQDAALSQLDLTPTEVEVVRALGIRSAMSVPFSVSGRVIGAITVFARQRQYGNDDLRLLEDFGSRLAVALENARLHQHAQAAVRVRDEFISVAAHELRTPVSTLLLAADALARRSGTARREDIAKMADRILTQIRRLNRLIEQMLDGSRIAAKRLALSLGRTDLAEVARSTADKYAKRLERAGCKLTLRADSPVVGEWDRTRLEQLLSSLLDNAVKFGAGTPIEVSVTGDGTNATLTVRDHGQGIPPERLRFVFGAFERAVSTAHYGGLGLGLFIARAIVEAHGGELAVDSRPGEGATLTARLPVKPPIDSTGANDTSGANGANDERDDGPFDGS
jgi:signal transduction histidine kinase